MAKVTLGQLCEQHDLLSASVVCHRSGNQTFYSCNLQWADESKPHGRGIVSSGSDDSHSDAVRKALAAMPGVRTPDLELAA